MNRPSIIHRILNYKATPYILGATLVTGTASWLVWRYSNYPQLLRPGTLLSSTITDVSRLAIIPVKQIYTPKTIDQVRSIIEGARFPVSIAGGRFSQGGQIATRNGIVIDTFNLNRIVSLDVAAKRIIVQPGVTWRQIQEAIDPHNLSVKVMQSYNDFTVGGSLSVNVHGRDVAYGPLVSSVESIKVMVATGNIVTASRSENPDLFAAALGGYGAMGIIVEATVYL
jgi:FAD/FMN-containing dehydrogenase